MHAGLSPPVSFLYAPQEYSQQPPLDATAEVVHVSAERELLRRAKQPIPAAPPNTPAAGMASPEHWDSPPLRETVTSVTKEVPCHCARPWDEAAWLSSNFSRSQCLIVQNARLSRLNLMQANGAGARPSSADAQQRVPAHLLQQDLHHHHRPALPEGGEGLLPASDSIPHSSIAGIVTPSASLQTFTVMSQVSGEGAQVRRALGTSPLPMQMPGKDTRNAWDVAAQAEGSIQAGLSSDTRISGACEAMTV